MVLVQIDGVCDVWHVRTSVDGTLDMHTGNGPVDWAPPPKIVGGNRASPAGRAVRPELSTRPDSL